MRVLPCTGDSDAQLLLWHVKPFETQTCKGKYNESKKSKTETEEGVLDGKVETQFGE